MRIPSADDLDLSAIGFLNETQQSGERLANFSSVWWCQFGIISIALHDCLSAIALSHPPSRSHVGRGHSSRDLFRVVRVWTINLLYLRHP